MGKTRVKANWSDPATTAENEVLPGYLKWAWTSRGVSLAVNVLLIMQLTYFCTDMLGLAPTLVGGLLLASKLFDGFTDLMVGFIIDKTNTKFGKARPYEVCIVLVWLFTILLYSTPQMGVVGTSAYIFVLYTLVNSICATFLNGGDAVYLARSVRSEKNRVSLMAFNGSFVMLFSIVIGIAMPQLIAGLGTTRAGWTVIACSIGIPMGLIGMLRYFFVKEVAAPPVEKNAAVSNSHNIPLKKGLSCVFQNKYIWILAGITFMTQLASNIGSSVNTYYFKYIVGDIGLGSLIGMTSLVTPFVIALFPLISRKIGTVKIMRIGAIIGVFGYVIRILGGTNIITLMLGTLLCSISILPVTMMISIYLIDCMDYGEWKTGVRVEGMLSSVNAFLSKLGSGIASGLVGIIMGMAGYSGVATVQSDLANSSIIALFNYVPLLLTIALLILAMSFNLDKLLPQVKKDLAAKKQ